MQVFIRVNNKLRRYVASNMPHDLAIEMVTNAVNDEIRRAGTRSIALAVIEGGRK